MRKILWIVFIGLGTMLGWAEPSSVRMTPTIAAVKKAMPWVVSIGTEMEVRKNDPYYAKLNDFWGFYYYRPRKIKEYTPLGSGIVIQKRGLVLTNWHVVRAADNVILRLKDGKGVPASIVGYDEQCDLCLLQMKTASDLAEAHLAQPDDVLLGETVITLGTPFGLEHSVSQGVISAINRSLDVTGESFSDMLQTDASINPGNSGGPLVNLDGEVIGINQAIRSGAQGIGFAIPVKRLELFLSRWLMPETFSTATLGLQFRSVSRGQGVSLEVEPKGAAAKAGLKSGDVVVAINGQNVQRLLDAGKVVWQCSLGSTVHFRLQNGRNVSYVLPEMTDSQLIAVRLGLRLQKLTKQLNEALDLPEDTRGLAISDALPLPEYRDGDSEEKDKSQTTSAPLLKRGDIVLGINDKKLSTLSDCARELRHTKSGDVVVLKVAVQVRDGIYQVVQLRTRLW